MLVDKDSPKDRDKKRKPDDMCQSSNKVKKVSLQRKCLHSEKSEGCLLTDVGYSEC